MASLVLWLSLLILILVLLIIKELNYLKNLISSRKKRTRIIVPSPALVKKETQVLKEKPKSSWWHNIGSRVSELDITRESIKERLSQKQALSEKTYEVEEEKREKLRKRIAELENKALTEATKPSIKETEDQIQEFNLPALEVEEENDFERFSSRLILMDSKINAKQLDEAKAIYKELLAIYNKIVNQAENKVELYNAVKQARDKLAQAIQAE